MRRSRSLKKATAVFVAAVFCFLAVFVAPVQATLVGTADLLQQQSMDQARQKVIQFMERQEVARHLKAWGVSPAEAKARVAVMTDEEISVLSEKIDQMPAGGDALGIALAIAILVFVVLIITDVLGVTDVFTFIKKR